MARNRERKQRKRVGLAFPARHVRLGRVGFRSPGRRAILFIGLLAIIALTVIALVAS